MGNNNNVSPFKPGFTTSSSLSTRSTLLSQTIDGSYQPKDTMWDRLTRSIYPSGKLSVTGAGPSRKNNPGLQRDLDYIQSIYDVLGMEFSGGMGESFKASPFTKGSFVVPLGKATISGDYEKRRTGHGFRNFDWNFGISVPLNLKRGKRR